MGADQQRRTKSGPATPAAVEEFIARWVGREGGQERANYSMFLRELCSALDIQPPDPAGDPETNDYVFECHSAWNKDPVFGVIGIQSGPRG